MAKLTLILGGARSGKSSFAEQKAIESGGRVTFIATAQALDDEMATRIRKHRARRPENWITLEIPIDIGRRLKHNHLDTDVALLDCITLLVSNLLMQASPDPDEPDETLAAELVTAEINALLQIIQQDEADWLVVSNEVGMGLTPPFPMGRVYRDLLGWTNQKLAAAADVVYLMVAGLAIKLK
jgi:adenosylcobinamide kinase/adenosylcobinamide-phosphate guanylyltransferase